jgi:hypothetical protein
MNRRFGGIYRLNLQGKKTSEEEISVLAGGLLASSFLLVCFSTLKIEVIYSSEKYIYS